MVPFLILAHEEDRGSAAVAASLRLRHGRDAVVVVTGTMLGFARWNHRLGRDGIRTRVEMPGMTLDSDRVGVVLNRLQRVDVPALRGASNADAAYAVNEMLALRTSWLTALPCPVLNRPLPALFPAEGSGWIARAARHGLPVQRRVATTSARRVQAHDLVVHAPVPDHPLALSACNAPVHRFVVGAGAALFATPLNGERSHHLIAARRVTAGCPSAWREPSAALSLSAGMAVLRVHRARLQNGRATSAVVRRAPGDAAVLHGTDTDFVAYAIDPHPQLLSDAEVNAVVEAMEEGA